MESTDRIASVVALVLSGVLASALVSATIWDTYCLFYGSPSDTVSVVIRKIITKWPIVAFMAGMLAGHLLW